MGGRLEGGYYKFMIMIDDKTMERKKKAMALREDGDDNQSKKKIIQTERQGDQRVPLALRSGR